MTKSITSDDRTGPGGLLLVRPRFLDQVEHETMYASSGNKYFFTKSCHRHTYQNYEQSRQKLGTILGNKIRQIFNTEQ